MNSQKTSTLLLPLLLYAPLGASTPITNPPEDVDLYMVLMPRSKPDAPIQVLHLNQESTDSYVAPTLPQQINANQLQKEINLPHHINKLLHLNNNASSVSLSDIHTPSPSPNANLNANNIHFNFNASHNLNPNLDSNFNINTLPTHHIGNTSFFGFPKLFPNNQLTVTKEKLLPVASTQLDTNHNTSQQAKRNEVCLNNVPPLVSPPPPMYSVSKKTTPSKKGLKKRLKEHKEHKYKNYQCEYCKERFDKIALLSEHTLMHINEKPFLCHMCCKPFKKRDELQKHIKNHYRQGVKSKSTATLSQRKEKPTMHLNPFQKSKNFFCTTCHKGFKSDEKMRQHSFCHQGTNPFQCNQCYKFFATEYDIRLHCSASHGISLPSFGYAQPAVMNKKKKTHT
ncbi:MAG: hypothetical protein AAF335_03415 [Bacteroidota bacterium]